MKYINTNIFLLASTAGLISAQSPIASAYPVTSPGPVLGCGPGTATTSVDSIKKCTPCDFGVKFCSGSVDLGRITYAVDCVSPYTKMQRDGVTFCNTAIPVEKTIIVAPNDYFRPPPIMVLGCAPGTAETSVDSKRTCTRCDVGVQYCHGTTDQARKTNAWGCLKDYVLVTNNDGTTFCSGADIAIPIADTVDSNKIVAALPSPSPSIDSTSTNATESTTTTTPMTLPTVLADSPLTAPPNSAQDLLLAASPKLSVDSKLVSTSNCLPGNTAITDSNGVNACVQCSKGMATCSTSTNGKTILATTCKQSFYLSSKFTCPACSLGRGSFEGNTLPKCLACSKSAVTCSIGGTTPKDLSCHSNKYLSDDKCTQCNSGTGTTYNNSDLTCTSCPGSDAGTKSCNFNVHPTLITSCTSLYSYAKVDGKGVCTLK